MHLLNEINWGLILGPFAYFMIVGGLLDGFFVFAFLRTRSFVAAFGQALLANVVSLFIGFVSWPYIFPKGFDFAEFPMGSYFLLWLVTMFTEALVLKLLRRSRPWRPVLAVSTGMNLVSFIILYLFFVFMN